MNQQIGWSNESKLLQTILKLLKRLVGLIYSINTSAGTDEKVKYDGSDPVAGYLKDKVVAGDGISITEGAGIDENKVEISTIQVLVVSQSEPSSPTDGLLWWKPDECLTTTTTTILPE